MLSAPNSTNFFALALIAGATIDTLLAMASRAMIRKNA
jgi:hypothetical protein